MTTPQFPMEKRPELRQFTRKKPVPEVISRESVYHLGQEIEKPFYRAIYYFIYLTGARVTEALNVKKEDIELEKVGGSPAIVVRVRTLKKKRGVKYRLVPIVLGDKRPIERDMWAYINEYADKFRSGQIFPNFKYTARVLVHYYFSSRITLNVPAIDNMQFLDNYEFKMRPHYLRHCRLTHLAQIYNMNALQLVNYAGWSDTKPAMIYIHYNWRDIANILERGA